MNKFQFLFLTFCFAFSATKAQTTYFKKVEQNKTIADARSTASNLQAYTLYKIDTKGLQQSLQGAPLQFVSKVNPKQVSIPMPDGSLIHFDMFESPVLAPQLAAKYPAIKTYSGIAMDKSGATITINFTSTGISILALGVNKEAVYFERHTTTPSDYYFSYFSKNSTSKAINLLPKKATCGINNKPQSIANNVPATKPIKQTRSTGTELRTFRLALCADAEFSNHRDSTKMTAYNDLVAYVARLNAIYIKELSCAFTLVSDTNLIYTGDTLLDPFSNYSQGTMHDENTTVLNDSLGLGGYDIGHVWGYSGASGEGLAAFNSLCNNTNKAEGASNEGDVNAYALIYFDQLFAHELGHQFGMSHSYNSNIPVCTTRSLSTSVEPGSGATIMSYGFTCSDNNGGNDDYKSFGGGPQLDGPILQFHAVNYLQTIDYLATIACGVTTVTNNTPPVITYKTPNDTIPKSTPFQLDAKATDADSNALTYCWEGMNIGAVDTPDASTFANTAEAPFFRTYDATADSFRVYPILTAILDSANVGRGDKLPSIGVETKHQITVRDGLGGVTQDSVVITIDSTEGPFLITSNLDSIYKADSTKTITWSVNNTDTRSPNVQIYLSIDGGLTFPYLLDSNAVNDGSAVIKFPNVATTTARLKVRGKGKIFFDISDSNFTIQAAPLFISNTQFYGQKVGTSNHLFWNYANAINTLKSFDVERSNDGITFENIGAVVVNSTASSKFNFVDQHPKIGTNFYRLKEVQLAGAFAYSKIIQLENNATLPNIYPNPVNTNVVIENVGIQYNVSLCDIAGKIIFEQKNVTGSLTINTSTFSKGLYVLKLANVNKGFTHSKKIIITR